MNTSASRWSIVRRGGSLRMVGILCAFVLALAACATEATTDPTTADQSPTTADESPDAPSPTSGSDGDVILTWWQPDIRDEWVAAYEMVIASFEEENPNVTVEVEVVPFGDLASQIQVARQSGTLPDLIYSFGLLHTGWAFSDMLLPLDDVLADLGRDNFPSGLMATSEIGGTVYAIPLAAYPHVLWYRADWFEDAGQEAPSSWEDMLQAAEVLHGDDRVGFGLYGATQQPFIVLSLMAANGASTFDEDGNVVINSEGTVEALEMLRSMAGFAESGAITQAQNDVRLAFAEEDCCAMFLSSTSVANFIGDRPDAFGGVPLPSNRGDKSATLDYAALVATNETQHPEEAKEFIRHWYADEALALDWATTTVTGHIATHQAVTSSDEYWAHPRIAPVEAALRAGMEAAVRGVGTGATFGPHPCTADLYAQDVWVEMMQRVIIGGESSEAVAEWAHETIEGMCG